MTARVGSLSVSGLTRIAAPKTPATVPVLIQVPVLRRRTRRVRRRRLKRSVRLAGAVLLLVVPLACFLLAWGAGPYRAANAEPPVVVLSTELEPAGPAGDGEPDAPIVLPAGYLLPEVPDDLPIQEGMAHAGS